MMMWFITETPEDREAKRQKQIAWNEEQERIRYQHDEKKAKFIESELKMYENCMCINKEKTNPYIYRGVCYERDKWWLRCEMPFIDKIQGYEISETIMSDDKYISMVKNARIRFQEFKSKLEYFKLSLVQDKEIKEEEIENIIQGPPRKSSIRDINS